jgi:SOS-response transcriptional repressor LexA
MNNGIENNIGYINANLKTEPNYIGSQIAILAEEDIKPIFKKGSIFIIDTKLNPENDTLVAVKKNGDSKILIRKFLICGENIILKSYNDNVNEIILSHNYKIIGVVVNVNTKI